MGSRPRSRLHAFAARAVHTAWSPAAVALLLASYVLLLCNRSFWGTLQRALGPASLADLPLLAAVAVALLALLWILFTLVAWRWIAKPLWILLLLLAVVAAYFMDSYGLVIDRLAIQSVIETDTSEASEWISLHMLAYLLLAAVPSLWLLWLPLRFPSWHRDLLGKLLGILLAVAVIAAVLMLNFQQLSSMARNHRELGHLIAPTNVLQSLYGYAKRRSGADMAAGSVATVAPDARRGPSWEQGERPRLLVLVVGESARASSFSLLGYPRVTNPRLASEGTYNFGNVSSCGTNTAVSLPCMFSDLVQANYSQSRFRARESLLDVLQRAGVRTQWLDNNTGSKHIALRTGEVSLAQAQDQAFCNASGCFDSILLDRLRTLLDSGQPRELIVLHQKGSHGPSYHERYPAEFRRFTPTCESNDLGDCERQQIINTYDNTILYADHNLAEIIDLLRIHANAFDSAMLYVSDHGESTGEGGMYLHGAPAFMAPEQQTRVPMILWLSDAWAQRDAIDRSCLQHEQSKSLSHDYLFHTVLGLLDVATEIYRPDLDLLANCRNRDQDVQTRPLPAAAGNAKP